MGMPAIAAQRALARSLRELRAEPFLGDLLDACGTEHVPNKRPPAPAWELNVNPRRLHS